MTDSPNAPEPSDADGPSREPAASNGAPAKGTGSNGAGTPAGRASVRSGLAERRNPVLVRLGGIATTMRRVAFRDPVALFLTLASIALIITFAVLLGAIKPARARAASVPITSIQHLADQKQVQSAVLLDHDSRVLVVTKRTAPILRADGTVPELPKGEKREKKTVTGAASSGTSGGAQELWAAYPASGAQTQQLASELGASGAYVTVDQQSGKATKTIVVQFLIPILILVCLFSLFMRVGTDGGAGGLAAFSEFTGKGKKKGKGTREKITFADVAGAGEAVAELKEIRDYLADPSKYLAVGAAAPKGVLLVGPPGTGKTLLAKAVAGEADAAFFSLSGSDFVESLVGVGAARVRDLFAKARKTAPAIIFIDEFDAAGRKRGAGIGQGNDEREQTLNQILVEMDGFSGDGGLVVMGATNRPDILDPALLRPGRFDRQVVDRHARRPWPPRDPAAARRQAAARTGRLSRGGRPRDARLQRRRARERDQRGGAAERSRRSRPDRPGDARGGDRPRRRRARRRNTS